MNKISLILFTVLCLIILAHGVYQGVSQGQWTSMTIALIVVVLGSYSMIKKSRK